MRTLARLAACIALTACVPACDEQPLPLRAFQTTSADQLVGGDVAMARVGDFILENDRIRVAILGEQSSPGPGVFGGTLVDADLRRPDARFRNGNGRDQFAEMFPFANLLVPRPDSTRITIVDDGSDGTRAVIRVAGDGAFFIDALEVLRVEFLLGIFNNVKMHLRFETDYILEPGKPYVRIVSRVWRTQPSTPCPDVVGDDGAPCGLDCPAGWRYKPNTGCPTCACAPEEPRQLTDFQDPQAIFLALFGDADTGSAPGVVAGDFTFFGAQNDLFAPGMGFDEDRAVFDPLFEGKDPFTHPLPLDYMAAAGGDVSYGYFTANGPGEKQPRVLVPIITSSTTAFATAAVTCPQDGSDEDCDAAVGWTWERYLVVGQGDVASVYDTVLAVRQVPTGRLEGAVLDEALAPVANGRLFVLTDPDDERQWTDVHEIVRANYEATGFPGVINAIDADVGLDPVEDGAYGASLPPGTYLVVASNEAQTSTSPVYRVTIDEDRTTTLHPIVPSPARVIYRVTDDSGRLLEAKLTFVSTDAEGHALRDDGLRRPYLGEGRYGSGIRHIATTITGQGTVEVEPGSYRLVVSHGPTYGIATVDLLAESGRAAKVDVSLAHEVDTTGWVGGDFHLHAEPSFDSGMKLEQRIASAVVEGLDLAVSTDHDVVTDYGPTVQAMGLRDRIATSIGVELSTLELGHFIAFPLAYDHLAIPDHLAPDWTCKDGGQLMETLSDHMSPGVAGVRIMAHPRDGFIGYISQLGVDPFDLSRTNLDREKISFDGGDLLSMEGGNPLFARSTCDFDAMEVFNSKRFDLIRTPTNEEIVLFNRCLLRIETVANGDHDALDAACPEVSTGGPLAMCPDGMRFLDCKMRHRRRLAYEMSRRILQRTVEEQEALWNHVPGGATDETACLPDTWPDAIPPEVASAPCVDHPGVVDDWMRWLDAGLAKTLTAASDSHGALREPGTPRTYVHTGTNAPQDIDPAQVARRIVDGAAMPTYGPVIHVSVAGKIPGQTASIGDDTFDLRLRVQTASWFGVDRVEIYVSGHLEEVLTDELAGSPGAVVDYDGTVTLPTPEGDGFVAVIAMGLDEENLLRPVYLDIPFGELQLPRVAALAFGSLPIFAGLLDAPILVPDFYPTFPLAMTNAIFLDVDGDGDWTRPGGLPAFCPRSCGETSPGESCPDDQVCLPDHEVCGFPIDGVCPAGPPGPD